VLKNYKKKNGNFCCSATSFIQCSFVRVKVGNVASTCGRLTAVKVYEWVKYRNILFICGLFNDAIGSSDYMASVNMLPNKPGKKTFSVFEICPTLRINNVRKQKRKVWLCTDGAVGSKSPKTTYCIFNIGFTVVLKHRDGLYLLSYLYIWINLEFLFWCDSRERLKYPVQFEVAYMSRYFQNSLTFIHKLCDSY
jgi:hypothetical protein